MARLHAAPLALMLLLYVVDVRLLKVGGGREDALGEVVVKTLALAAGSFGQGRVWVFAAALVAVATAITALVMLWCEQPGFSHSLPSRHSPRPPWSWPSAGRHSFTSGISDINVLFLLLLASYAAGRLWRRRAAGLRGDDRGAAGVCGGKCPADVRFSQGWARAFSRRDRAPRQPFGRLRGHDRRHRPRSRNVIYAEFYSRFLDGRHHFSFLAWEPDMPVKPEWMLVNSQDPNFHPPATAYPFRHPPAYMLEGLYPFAGLSGMHFAVYHRSPEADESSTP